MNVHGNAAEEAQVPNHISSERSFAAQPDRCARNFQSELVKVRIAGTESDLPRLRGRLARHRELLAACLLGNSWRLILDVDRFEAILGDAKCYRSAVVIASQDPETRLVPGTVTVPLRSRTNASPFWIMLLLV